MPSQSASQILPCAFWGIPCSSGLPCPCHPFSGATEPEPCGRLLVGQGDDTYDPLCVLPKGHGGVCKPQEGTDVS